MKQLLIYVVCATINHVYVCNTLLGGTNMIQIEMENGKKIKIELYPDIAPISCENFEKLVRRGFYNGLTFHRVIPGFMIQVGLSRANFPQTA